MILGLEVVQMHNAPDVREGYSSDDTQADSLIMLIELLLFRYLDMTFMGSE